MKKTMYASSARIMHKRIRKTQRRAQLVGILYLIATLLLGVLAFMPTLKIEYLNVIPGLREGKVLWEDLNLGLNIDTISRAIYLIMLLTTVINVIRIFNNLSWLYKKKGSKMYGFNRNVFAMQKMGRIFSSAFAFRLIGNTFLLLINGTYAGATNFDFALLKNALVSIKDLSFGINVDIPVAIAFVVIGVVFRLLCGFLGAKVSYFTTNIDGTVTEESRRFGRFAPLFRNFLQLAVVLAIPLFLLLSSKIYVFANSALHGKFSVDILAFVQIALFLCWIVLTAHAANMTEYNHEGAEGKGMKNFRIFISFALILSVVSYLLVCMGGTFNFAALKFTIDNVDAFHALMLIAICFVMFIIEMIMKDAPAGRAFEMDGSVSRRRVEDEEYTIEEGPYGNPNGAAPAAVNAGAAALGAMIASGLVDKYYRR